MFNLVNLDLIKIISIPFGDYVTEQWKMWIGFSRLHESYETARTTGGLQNRDVHANCAV